MFHRLQIPIFLILLMLFTGSVAGSSICEYILAYSISMMDRDMDCSGHQDDCCKLSIPIGKSDPENPFVNKYRDSLDSFILTGKTYIDLILRTVPQRTIAEFTVGPIRTPILRC